MFKYVNVPTINMKKLTRSNCYVNIFYFDFYIHNYDFTYSIQVFKEKVTVSKGEQQSC